MNKAHTIITSYLTVSVMYTALASHSMPGAHGKEHMPDDSATKSPPNVVITEHLHVHCMREIITVR